jgi:hypothetical protein
MEYTSRSLEIVSKDTFARDDNQVEELREPEEECQEACFVSRVERVCPVCPVALIFIMI